MVPASICSIECFEAVYARSLNRLPGGTHTTGTP